MNFSTLFSYLSTFITVWLTDVNRIMVKKISNEIKIVDNKKQIDKLPNSLKKIQVPNSKLYFDKLPNSIRKLLIHTFKIKMD
jgi:hypothetical protein